MEGQVSQKRTTFQGPCFLKMLVNNLVAGAIIGKAGGVIASIEQSTGCSLKLSPANAFYPGTTDRVLIMGGEQQQLNEALLCILEKIRDTVQQFGNSVDGGRAKAASNDSVGVKVVCKLAVPKSAVSAIIGKGGQQIRELQEQTQARVQVSSREEGLVERMITITGNIEQVHLAVVAVSSCIQTDVNLKDHMYVIYRNTGNGNGFMTNMNGGGNMVGGMGGYINSNNTNNGYNNSGGGGGFGGINNNNPYGGGGGGYNSSNNNGGGVGGGGVGFPALGGGSGMGVNGNGMGVNGMGINNIGGNYDLLSSHCDIIIQVPDPTIGFVIGKNGSCVSEIISATGARIQISQKGDLVPGTNERRIVISGTVHAVHNAHMLLLQRIHSVNELTKKQNHNNNSQNGSQSDRNSNASNSNNTVNLDQQGVYVM